MKGISELPIRPRGWKYHVSSYISKGGRGIGDSVKELVMHYSGKRCFLQVICNVATWFLLGHREMWIIYWSPIIGTLKKKNVKTI